MNLELRHLKLVLAIAEAGGVTRAGHLLHLTQSALSHQLRDAEERLGTPLFQRRNRKMALTPAGERLLRSARAIRNELEGAEDEIRRTAAGQEGVLRISTQCYTVYHWLPSRMRLFQQEYPRVEIEVVVDSTPHPFTALLEGKLDVAIISAPIRDRRILYTPLFEDEIVGILPPGHRLAVRPYLLPQDYSGENLIIYPPKEESTLLNTVLARAGITPRAVRQCMLTEAIIELVKAGLGIGALARWAVAPQLASGALCAVPLIRGGYHRQWSAARLRTPGAPPYLSDFIQLLAEYPISRPLARATRQARIAAGHAGRAARKPSPGIPEHFAVEWKAPRHTG